MRISTAAILTAWAFISLDCETLVPRNGWSRKWGPMVPHKTFPGDCGICHVPEAWDILRKDFSYDHQKETGYPLQGAHVAAACLRCHNDRGPVGAYVARGCGGCHSDPHKSALGLDCTRCHDQTTWRPGGLIAEHARTRFPIFGAHAATPCESCHQRAPAGDFRGAPVECELCHQRDLARATSPDHLANGWVTRCERCHAPSGWSGADFQHDFFPLAGGHSGLSCTRCHTSGTSGPIPSDCYSCHQADYQGAPNHVAQNYSTDCSQCHTISSWDASAFNHSFFPLTGGHSGLSCSRCHTSGTVGPIPSSCYSCHQADYQGAPNHASQGYPTDCTQCHSNSSWAATAFNHRFSLRGPHNVSCTTCHQGGSFSSFNCLVCHEHRQSAMDSEHREVNGYSYSSQACYQCHPSGKG